ncbi:MAG: indolepyruvate oxidoreductase subunit beta family protein [Proteobacteria bacterium]|nr:indolepyruvate oxidoreductase subunit beta family protein [Pseudomonadota bacterium]
MTIAPSASPVLDTTKPLAIAVMAMGGQGGGVLVDWIVALCESQHWVAQSTSVPGVAQRTGATIYFIETLPLPKDAPRVLRPVLSLMAEPGEVDIVIGAELMEAGRAIQRGLVTPDRTTLIASSHRSYAVVEKQAPGDGIGDAEAVYAAAGAAAKSFIAFDMAALAERSGSVVSAVLFGALAATRQLPFERAAFETTIRAAGVGVEPSLRAFALGYDQASADLAAGQKPVAPMPAAAKRFPALAPLGHGAYDALVARASASFPAPTLDMISAGLQRVVDFQDVAYGGDFLDLLADMLARDKAAGGEAKRFALTRTAAKYLAVAMAYDDVFRVADLKTRGSRFDRVRAQMAATPDQLVYMTEFMHPRMDEVAGSLPAAIGRYIERSPRLLKLLDGFVNRGRRVKTGTIGWFLMLYLLGGLRRFRRGTLRHANEVVHRDAWLANVRAAAAKDYALAVELLQARRLVKGYSDTHARGRSKFDKVMTGAEKLDGRPDAALWVRRLREAALKDEDGVALSGALKTIDSFV